MPSLLITVHPFDPWGSKIGGIESAIRSMLHHAPPEMELSLVGVTECPRERPVGHWQTLDFRGKSLRFYPLFSIENPNRRTWVPLFLRFALQLRFCPFDGSNSIVVYHRIEPLALTNPRSHARILCVHGDPREWIGSRSEVRWRYIPWLYRKMESKAIQKARRLLVVSRTRSEERRVRERV